MYEVNEHGCWIWTGSFYKNGTPKHYLLEQGYAVNARLFHWKQSGQHATVHTFLKSQCGNNKCVNPDHHRRAAKVRGSRQVQREQKSGQHDEEIVKMHKSGYGHGAIVEKFGIEQDEVFMALFRENLIFQDMHQSQREFILS